ncbi:MAG: hypothetical protein HQL82_10785 [Magnetococcales bacterium]|nr:hypothetical protein [Magnetococcales bacterium]
MKDLDQARMLLAMAEYEAFPEFEADIDRAATTALVKRFLAYVRQLSSWEEQP